MEELKKCPFCGGEASLCNCAVMQNDKWMWSVECAKCGVIIDRENKNDVIEAWNTRKPMGLIVERLEALRAEHEEREKDARLVGLTKHADLNGIKAYIYDDAIDIVKEGE